MARQEASAVVAVPLPQVQERLGDVEGWTAFLAGVEQIRRTGHQRYTFVVRPGVQAQPREVAVSLVPHAREHRITWHALSGPRYDGQVRLAAVDARHTRIHLELVAEPASFLAGLGELLGAGSPSAAVDLLRLEEWLTAPR